MQLVLVSRAVNVRCGYEGSDVLRVLGTLLLLLALHGSFSVERPKRLFIQHISRRSVGPSVDPSAGCSSAVVLTAVVRADCSSVCCRFHDTTGKVVRCAG